MKCCRRSSSSFSKPCTATTFFVSYSSFLLALSSLLRPSAALVNLRAKSFSFTFLDAPARFAVPVRGSGVCGALHTADPIDACSTLPSNRTAVGRGGGSAHSDFILIVRGVCSFENKVRIAQDAGYQAAIIYDDQEKGSLYSMIGDSTGIYIHAVFVSKMAVSVLAAFLFARNCRLLRHGAHKRPPSMNRQAVELLPSFTFKSSYVNSKRMAETCAICLEDYRDGERLRVLPCLHDFHAVCVDSWLTKWGTFCPICKHEMSSGE
ncbi:receptor homology region, transmembrane domain- and RING domain-containing protein 2-like isoform X3 [Phoenix dactylifera]|uniref:RING-type E3 ubiquitin transferase n=1 Tax=Phoenix dactylifera TaxID=42345 RepID=A0A8B8ZYG3_PHODC|nr:receptor homology region, transmembrane domain- and RING domain-containing protein 2-like isoform X3 [Phoenix dactylifera]